MSTSTGFAFLFALAACVYQHGLTERAEHAYLSKPMEQN
jgi:hypothetical protein